MNLRTLLHTAPSPADLRPAVFDPGLDLELEHGLDPGSTPSIRRLDSPVGRIELTGDGSAVTSVAVEKAGHLPDEDLAEHSDRILDNAADQLIEYFSGTRTVFDVPVALGGSHFQRAVWSTLRDVPFGETLSYGAIGLATGHPTAGRAVGGAIAANPVPFFIPCHRVLGADRRVTGYSVGEGIPTKIWLLDHEGIGHRQ